MNTYLKLLMLSVSTCLLAACTTPLALPSPTVSPQPETHAIVLGDISDDPGEVIEGTQPLADYLAEQLTSFGITEGRVIVAYDTETMIDLLKAGEVDLYCDSVYPATLVSDASGAKPILRRWRFGVEAYHTVIFASKESGITALDELPGHVIAMDTPFSTSGFLLPAVHLTEHDLQLVGKASYDDPVTSANVGFVFTYDDENTLQWVLSGRVAAGATDDYHYEVAFPEEARDRLISLAETESVPRQVVVAGAHLDAELLDAIKTALLTAHETEAGQAALEPFQTTRFDTFPDGIKAAQEEMRQMMVIVQQLPMP